MQSGLSEYLAIGEITKPQGVRGMVKLRPLTCDIARFDGLAYAFLLKDGAYARVPVTVERVEPDAVYLYIDGISDRDDAETLRGALLYIDRAHAVKLDADANFICDLIGCVGVDDAGAELGTLTDVLQPGGGDVYEFRGARGTVLVPALKSVVLSVDVEKKRMLLSAKRLSEVAVFED